MLGTIVNVVSIVLGSCVGMLIGNRIPDRYSKIVFQAIGLAVMGIGISMTLKSNNMLITTLSIIIGGLLGEWMRLEEGLERWAEKLKGKIKIKSVHFTTAFVTATILYCSGSMAILGSIEDGLGHTPNLLFTKSMMDGITAVAFSASMGIGVIFSAIPILIYQGSITIFAEFIHRFLTEPMIAEMTAVGGLMLIGLSLNLLKIKTIPVMNFIPALVIAILLAALL